MIRKKIIVGVALTLMLALMLATGCSSPTQDNSTNFDTPGDNTAGSETHATNDASGTTDTPKILCAAFAEYDWTRTILGDNPARIKLGLLNESGMDMHSYQPSVADMVDIADADLMIFTGGDSEFWIEDALVSSESATRTHMEMMEIFEQDHELADRYSTDDGDHDHEAYDAADITVSTDSHDHEDHIHATDEHLWLSPKMAPAFIEKIADAIAALDPVNADYYSTNAEKYIEEIRDLDARFEAAAAGAHHRTLLFADRYPFKYFLEDYGLEHIAAFPGCSAETEASFETILDLSEAVDKLNLNSVMVLHKSKPDLAQTIIKNSGCEDAQILYLNSMQSVTAKDIERGATWLSIMEDNLAAIEQALK